MASTLLLVGQQRASRYTDRTRPTPIWKGQRYEKPAVQQLWHLSWASISGFSPKGPGSLCPASQQLMTAWPARPLKTSLAIFTLEEVAGCPLPELCQHGMLLRKVDCDRQMGHCLKSQSCGQGQDVSVGTSGGVGRNLNTVSEFRDNSTLERLTLSPTGCASDFIILAGNAGVVCL